MSSVDVVIPNYNHANFLPQCVQSVLSQGVDDLRIIVIDNASTDDSLAVAQALAELDRRIEIVAHPDNVGPHASFNEGIDLARADYFMILCADDILAPDILGIGMQLLEHCPEASCVIGTSAGPWTGEPLLAPSEPPQWFRSEGEAFIGRCCLGFGQDVPAHAILSRTSVQKAAGHYRAALTHMDDLEMLLRLAHLGPVLELGTALVGRRIHSSNLSEALWQDRLKDLREREAAFDSFFDREGAGTGLAPLHRIVRRRLAEAAFWSAVSHLCRGRSADGVRLLRYGFRLNPTSVLLPPMGHVFRMKGGLTRIANVLAEALRNALAHAVPERLK